MIVRYEDFEANPAPVMHTLCRWSGIPFEQVLTQPSMMGVPWSNNSSFIKQPSGVDPLPEREIVLTAEERDYVLSATEPFRDRFGYM